MIDALYCKHLLIRTPLAPVLSSLRWALDWPRRLRHPELRAIYREPRHMERVIRACLRPDSCCIDVGCHLGSMLNLFIACSPRGSHFAFEPVPRKAAWLKRKFPEVSVHAIALSDAPGRLTFHEDVTRPGYSSLAPSRRRGDRVTEYEVDVDRLDNRVPATALIRLLKLDVEGAELMVLRGAERTIRRCRPVICFESTPRGCEGFDYTREDLHRYITGDLGMRIYRFEDFLAGRAALDAQRFEQCHHYPFQAFNFLALADDDPLYAAAGRGATS